MPKAHTEDDLNRDDPLTSMLGRKVSDPLHESDDEPDDVAADLDDGDADDDGDVDDDAADDEADDEPRS